MSKLPISKLKVGHSKHDTDQKTPLKVTQTNNKENKLLNKVLDSNRQPMRTITPTKTPLKNNNLLTKLACTPRNEAHVESHIKQMGNNTGGSGCGSAKKYTNYLKLSNNLASSKLVEPTPEKINPIVNGIDYTDMINKKEEYGYVGPGYIVEFTCDPKYLKGFIVDKGLWKAITPHDYKPISGCVDLGPPVYFIRLDNKPLNGENNEAKIHNYDFSWRSKYANFHVNKNTPSTLKSAASILSLETSEQHKVKKSIKWANDLVQTHELSGDSSAAPTPEFPIKRKLRRSFSHSEINIGSPSMTNQQEQEQKSEKELNDENNCDGVLKKLPMINDDELDDDNLNMIKKRKKQRSNGEMSIAIDLIQTQKFDNNSMQNQNQQNIQLPPSPPPECTSNQEFNDIPLTNPNNLTNDKKKHKKSVRFPDEVIKDYSEPPKKWIHGLHSTSDLLDSYCNSCEKYKCKPIGKLVQQLRALQDVDGINGEKVNVLNLKKERLDIKQIEALEEVFKRLSFKTIDFDQSYFDGEETISTLFEILDYYDTCEKLILSNLYTINLFGWQALSKLLRKSSCLEQLDLKGYLFPDYYHLSHLARALRLNSYLRVLHLENSNIQGKLLIMLLNSIKENNYLKELYLCDNKLQSSDGIYIGVFLKEFKNLEYLDLRSNNLQDLGLSHICSGLSEQANAINGLKTLVLANNHITLNGMNYIAKALIHNQSLVCLNLSQNVITNEGMFILKEALITNNRLNTLILVKTKISDEGVVALAEYLAETQTLTRLDLRENDVRLAGIMALASSLKFNKTITWIDLDKEYKRDSYVKDYVDQFKRLYQDINEYCNRNKQHKMEKEAQLNTIINLELKIPQNEYQYDNKTQNQINDYINLKSPPLSPITNMSSSNDSSLDNHDTYDDEYQIIDTSNKSVTSDITNTSFECVDSSDLSELSDLMNEIELKIENNSMNSDDDGDALISSCLFKNDEDLLGEEISIKIDPEQDNQEQSCEEVEIDLRIASRKETLSLIHGPFLSSISENDIDFDESQVAQTEEAALQKISELTVKQDDKIINTSEPMTSSVTCLSNLFDEESNDMRENTSDCSILAPNNPALMNSVSENDIEVSSDQLNERDQNETQNIRPCFASKLTNSQIENEISSEIGLK